MQRWLRKIQERVSIAIYIGRQVEQKWRYFSRGSSRMRLITELHSLLFVYYSCFAVNLSFRTEWIGIFSSTKASLWWTCSSSRSVRRAARRVASRRFAPSRTTAMHSLSRLIKYPCSPEHRCCGGLTFFDILYGAYLYERHMWILINVWDALWIFCIKTFTYGK